MNETTEIINETIEPTKSGWKTAWKIIKTIGLVFTYALGYCTDWCWNLLIDCRNCNICIS